MSDKELNKKIKESFEQSGAKAPEDLWSDISGKLNDSDEEKAIDQKIKESFKSSSHKAPEHVWKNVNNRLNIDRIWVRIKRRLIWIDLYNNLKRVAAVLLLLFGVFWSVKTQFFPSSDETISSPVISEQTPSENSNPFPNEKETAPEQNEATNPEVKEYQSKTGESENEHIKGEKTKTQSSNNAIAESNEEQEDLSIPEKGEVRQESTENNPERNPKPALNKTKKPGKEKEIPSNQRIDEPGVNKNEQAKSQKENPVNPNRDKPGKNNERLTPINSLPFIASNNFNKGSGINSIKREEIYDPSEYFNEDQNNSSLEAGIFYALNYTEILNNDTRTSFEETSLITSESVITGNCGFKLDYHFNNRHSINTTFYSRSVNQQNYKTYINGNYLEKQLMLEYYKLNIEYGFNLSGNSENKKLRNIIKAGHYFSYLKSGQVNIGGEKSSLAQDFRKTDFGISLSFTQEIGIGDKIWFGYGLHGEKGLQNIHWTSPANSSEKDPTTLQNIGAHFTLKYKL